MSYKSKDTVRSLEAAEILETSEAIDEGNKIKFISLLILPVRLVINVQSFINSTLD